MADNDTTEDDFVLCECCEDAEAEPEPHPLPGHDFALLCGACASTLVLGTTHRQRIVMETIDR